MHWNLVGIVITICIFWITSSLIFLSLNSSIIIIWRNSPFPLSSFREKTIRIIRIWVRKLSLFNWFYFFKYNLFFSYFFWRRRFWSWQIIINLNNHLWFRFLWSLLKYFFYSFNLFGGKFRTSVNYLKRLQNSEYISLLVWKRCKLFFVFFKVSTLYCL